MSLLNATIAYAMVMVALIIVSIVTQTDLTLMIAGSALFMAIYNGGGRE